MSEATPRPDTFAGSEGHDILPDPFAETQKIMGPFEAEEAIAERLRQTEISSHKYTNSETRLRISDIEQALAAHGLRVLADDLSAAGSLIVRDDGDPNRLNIVGYIPHLIYREGGKSPQYDGTGQTMVDAYVDDGYRAQSLNLDDIRPLFTDPVEVGATLNNGSSVTGETQFGHEVETQFIGTGDHPGYVYDAYERAHRVLGSSTILDSAPIHPELYAANIETAVAPNPNVDDEIGMTTRAHYVIAGAVNEVSDGQNVLPLPTSNTPVEIRDFWGKLNSHPYVQNFVRLPKFFEHEYGPDRHRTDSYFEDHLDGGPLASQFHINISPEHPEVAPWVMQQIQMVEQVIVASSVAAPAQSGSMTPHLGDIIKDPSWIDLDLDDEEPVASARQLKRYLATEGRPAFQHEVPTDTQGYIAHTQALLEGGITPNPGRTGGLDEGTLHKSRIRYDNQPSGTYEFCSPDTWLYNGRVIGVMATVMARVVRTLERARIEGREGELAQAYPALFSLDAQALSEAADTTQLASALHGTNAEVDGVDGQQASLQELSEAILAVAMDDNFLSPEENQQLALDDDDIEVFRNAYSTPTAEDEAAWQAPFEDLVSSTDEQPAFVSVLGYYETNKGTPAWWMQRRYEQVVAYLEEKYLSAEEIDKVATELEEQDSVEQLLATTAVTAAATPHHQAELAGALNRGDEAGERDFVAEAIERIRDGIHMVAMYDMYDDVADSHHHAAGAALNRRTWRARHAA